MKTVAITGASGVVGARVLHHVLARNDVGRVVALGRRALPIAHEKLESKVVELARVEAIARELPDDVAIAICCLGTTMKKAGSKEAFRAVDHDAVVAFGAAALQKGAKRFLLVSAAGANARSMSFYMRTKGEAEESLAKLGYAQLTILRPWFIDDEGARTEHRLGESIALPLNRALTSIVGKKSRYAPISADTIAKALVQLAFDASTERSRVLESDRLHQLADQT